MGIFQSRVLKCWAAAFLVGAILPTPCLAQMHDVTKTYQVNTGKGCPPENQVADAGTNFSDPINLATGDFMEARSDLFIPGRGLDFNLRRIYRSKSGAWTRYGQSNFLNFQSPLGKNADHSYNMRIQHHYDSFDSPFNSLAFLDGTGRADLFPIGDNWDLSSYINNPGEVLTLENDEYFAVLEFRGVDQEILLIQANKTVYRFHALEDASGPTPESGRLKSITDRNGNQIQIFYVPVDPWSYPNAPFEWLASRISYIIDTLGNRIDFYYHDDVYPPNQSVEYPSKGDSQYRHLLWKVVDHAGRTVYYQYGFEDKDWDIVERQLTRVVLPEIKNDTHFSIPSEHARFNDNAATYDRRSWSYEWENGGLGSRRYLMNQLIRVFNPNGDQVTENNYSNWEIPVELNPDACGVVQQSYGTDKYYYTATDEDGNRLLGGFVYNAYYVWVVNRRGNVTRFKYTGTPEPEPEPELSTEAPPFQLIEKVEYPGVVPLIAKDTQVWATVDNTTEDGDVIQWHYLLIGSVVEKDFAGLVNPKRATDLPVTTKFTRNDNWRVESETLPNGDTVQSVYDSTNADPRGRGAMTSRTITPSGGEDSITEYWEYDFDFLNGGGCGCGAAGFESAHIDGKGNVTIKEYESGPSSNGNLIKILHDFPPGTSTVAGSYNESEALAIEEFAYNTYGQVVKYTHPKKTMWDAGTESETVESRVDEFEYYNTPGQLGYGRLRLKRVDTEGVFAQNLTTEYFYDKIGNVVKKIDPNGSVTKYLYNQHSEMIRSQYFDDTETLLYAQTDYFYDANGNLVREEVLDIDESRDPNGSYPTITTVHEYDILDFKTKTSRERLVFEGVIVEDDSGRATALTDSNWVVQEWEYDENRNLTMFRDGEAVRGNQPDNKIVYEYDFRNKLFSETHGVGVDQYRVEYDYDQNGRQISKVVNPGVPADSQEWSQSYDAFNRVTQSIDPLGNAASYTYDDNHNITQVTFCGPMESGGNDYSTLLQVELEYDRRDRLMTESFMVFDNLDGSPSVCGSSPLAFDTQTTTYEYNNDSSLLRVHEPSADSGSLFNTSSYYYDTVGRIEYEFDGLGNSRFLTYDTSSNLHQVFQYDVSTSGGADQEFVVQYSYDWLDRRIASVDSVLNSIQWAYDSRSNLVHKIDARENQTSYEYDGLNRLTKSTVRMTADGDGPETDPVLDPANPEILTTIEYDDSSRVIAETDDNGNTTTYAYDALNRRTSITMPDGKSYLTQYNANGVASRLIDARGVVLDLEYDLNNRLTMRTVDTVAGPTPAGALAEKFVYDGLGRVILASNYSDSAGTLGITQITRQYDSRGFVVREIQNADGASGFPALMNRVVNYEFDLANNPTRTLYPHGRDIQRSYDSINRLINIEDHQTATPMSIAAFDYVGRRLESRINGNSTQTSYQYNGFIGNTPVAGDLGVGRVANIQTTNTNTAATLDEFSFTWDAAQNRTSYKDLGSGMKNRRERTFGYDSSDRLVSTDVDFPDPATDFTSPTNSGITNYDLDGVHNRFSVTGFQEAGAPIGIYKDEATDLPDHVKNNQYTFSPREGGGDWTYAYDGNGNMILKAQYNAADFTGDYVLNFVDVSAFTAAYQNGDMSADINGDGVVGFSDVSAFMTAFSQSEFLDNQHYTYDLRNQLVNIEFRAGNSVQAVVTNTYDPFARRLIEATDDNDGSIMVEKQMVYGGVSLWEVIEQIQLAEGAIPEKLLTTHIFGLGIDDEVAYRLEDYMPAVDYWSHRDDLNSLTSITDASGDVKERYQYGDYGQVTIFDPAGIEIPASIFGATHLYTGRSLITGTGLQDSRWRVLDLETGRFRQRDPLGYVDSMSMYAYIRSSPLGSNDPFGLTDSVTMSIPMLVSGGFTAKEIAGILGISLAAANGLIYGEEIRQRAEELVERVKRQSKGKNPCEKARDALRQAEDTIESLGKRIQQHHDKISDPNGCGGIPLPGKPGYHPKRQPGVIKYWEKEVRILNRERDVARKAVKILKKAVSKACRKWYKPWTW